MPASTSNNEERMYSTPPTRTPFSAADRTLHSAGSDPEPLKNFNLTAEPNKPTAEHIEAQTSSLPPSFVERGNVLSSEEMTTRYTDEEWEELFEEVEGEVKKVQHEGRKVELGDVAGTIDHTLLRLDATEEEVRKLCEEARREGFASVCVRPHHVSLCTTHPIKTASVISFHTGTQPLPHSLLETRTALTAGATELDIVLNHPLLLSSTPNRYSKIYNDLVSLRQQSQNITLKLILETSALKTEKNILKACTLAAAANFDFVKTSTGFAGGGASVENVEFMGRCCAVLEGKFENNGKRMKVKASGGIRSLGDAVRILEAGADRLGTSGGVGIVREIREGGRGKGVGMEGEGY